MDDANSLPVALTARVGEIPMQHDWLTAFRAKAAADPAIAAVWLEGSLGRGGGDRFSDVDAHVLLAPPETAASFAGAARDWLDAIRPLVLFREMFGGKMLNTVTSDGLRLDVWIHDDAKDAAALDPARALVLHDAGGIIGWRAVGAPGAPPEDVDAKRAALARSIGEFWRCIAILPSVVGRGELIVGVMGLFALLAPLTDTLIIGAGVTREAGVKNLNRCLPDGLRAEIEAASTMRGLTPETVARAHMGLAAIMRRHGQDACARYGAHYPTELEETVMRYVTTELAALGVETA